MVVLLIEIGFCTCNFLKLTTVMNVCIKMPVCFDGLMYLHFEQLPTDNVPVCTNVFTTENEMMSSNTFADNC
jgi:peroxiredoxin family protein